MLAEDSFEEERNGNGNVVSGHEEVEIKRKRKKKKAKKDHDEQPSELVSRLASLYAATLEVANPNSDQSTNLQLAERSAIFPEQSDLLVQAGDSKSIELAACIPVPLQVPDSISPEHSDLLVQSGDAKSIQVAECMPASLQVADSISPEQSELLVQASDAKGIGADKCMPVPFQLPDSISPEQSELLMQAGDAKSIQVAECMPTSLQVTDSTSPEQSDLLVQVGNAKSIEVDKCMPVSLHLPDSITPEQSELLVQAGEVKRIGADTYVPVPLQSPVGSPREGKRKRKREKKGKEEESSEKVQRLASLYAASLDSPIGEDPLATLINSKDVCEGDLEDTNEKDIILQPCSLAIHENDENIFLSQAMVQPDAQVLLQEMEEPEAEEEPCVSGDVTEWSNVSTMPSEVEVEPMDCLKEISEALSVCEDDTIDEETVPAQIAAIETVLHKLGSDIASATPCGTEVEPPEFINAASKNLPVIADDTIDEQNIPAQTTVIETPLVNTLNEVVTMFDNASAIPAQTTVTESALINNSSNEVAANFENVSTMPCEGEVEQAEFLNEMSQALSGIANDTIDEPTVPAQTTITEATVNDAATIFENVATMPSEMEVVPMEFLSDISEALSVSADDSREDPSALAHPITEATIQQANNLEQVSMLEGNNDLCVEDYEGYSFHGVMEVSPQIEEDDSYCPFASGIDTNSVLADSASGFNIESRAIEVVDSDEENALLQDGAALLEALNAVATSSPMVEVLRPEISEEKTSSTMPIVEPLVPVIDGNTSMLDDFGGNSSMMDDYEERGAPESPVTPDEESIDTDGLMGLAAPQQHIAVEFPGSSGAIFVKQPPPSPPVKQPPPLPPAQLLGLLDSATSYNQVLQPHMTFAITPPPQVAPETAKHLERTDSEIDWSAILELQTDEADIPLEILSDDELA